MDREWIVLNLSDDKDLLAIGEKHGATTEGLQGLCNDVEQWAKAKGWQFQSVFSSGGLGVMLLFTKQVIHGA
jgi:hypothetical protein